MRHMQLQPALWALSLASSITAQALLSSNSNMAQVATISTPQITSTIIPGQIDIKHANDDEDDLVLALGTQVSSVEVLHTTLTTIMRRDATTPWQIEKRAKRTQKHHSVTSHKRKHTSKRRNRHRTTSKSHHFTISPASTRILSRHGVFGPDQIDTHFNSGSDASSSSDSDSTITLDDGREMVCDGNEHCAWKDDDGFLFPIKNGELPNCGDEGDDEDGPGYCLNGRVTEIVEVVEKVEDDEFDLDVNF